MAMFGRQTEEDRARADAYARWLQQRNPFAVASMVLGVFSLIEFGALIIFGIGGIVCGVIGLMQLRRGSGSSTVSVDRAAAPGDALAEPLNYSDQRGGDYPKSADYEPRIWNIPRDRGHRLAWIGITTSVLSLIIAALLYLRVFG